MSRTFAIAGLLVALGTTVDAAPQGPVTIFLERNGRVVDHEGEEVIIPRFGGGDLAWNKITQCVKAQFAPFQIDIVDARPRTGDFITAVIGGRASQLGLDDRSTNGVGPYIPNRIQRNAVVHVFSKVGTGERDTQNLCAVTVHEVSHALGLDHTYKCGDMMSYFLDRCGPRRFLDVDAPCGEFSARLCGDGSRTQNSHRMIASLVGLRQAEPQPAPDPDLDDPRTDPDPWGEPDAIDDPSANELDAGDTDDADDADDIEQEPPVRWRGRGGYTVERYRGRDGRTWVIIRRSWQR